MAKTVFIHLKIVKIDKRVPSRTPDVIGKDTNVILQRLAEYELTRPRYRTKWGFAQEISVQVCFVHDGNIEGLDATAGIFGKSQEERTLQFLSAARKTVSH